MAEETEIKIKPWVVFLIIFIVGGIVFAIFLIPDYEPERENEEFLEYHDNGEIRTRQKINNDYGYIYIYDRDGNIEQEHRGNFKDGYLIEGTRTSYYKSGNKKEEQKGTFGKYWLNEGTLIFYGRNGEIEKEGRGIFKGGELIEGTTRVFEDGKVINTERVPEKNTPKPIVIIEPEPIPVQPPTPIVDVSEDDDAVLGNLNAPVTIIEFSDYECPFCARFYNQTLPSIKSEYIDTGKVKYVFRDYSSGFEDPSGRYHPLAQPAAEASECVREQGGDNAFWKYHDMIFENQAQLSEANLLKWAMEMNYDIKDCLDSNKFESEVKKDFRDGQAAGVRGTPAFFINGKLLSGAQPFGAFKQAIDAELAG